MNTILKYTLTLCLLVFALAKPIVSGASEQKIDSLKQVCLNEKDTVTLVDNYNWLAMLYAYSNVDSMLKYGKIALEIARQANYKQGIGDALFYVSYGYDQTGDWEEAIENLEYAIVIYNELKDTTSLVGSYLNLGVLYSYGTQQVKGLEYIIKAKNLAEKKGDRFGLPEAYTNIGSYYEYLKEYRSAYLYYAKALEIEEEENETDNISMSNIALGYINIKLKNLDEALDNLKDARKLLPQIEDLHRETEVMILFAYYYLEVDNLSEAEATIQKADSMVRDQKFERLNADLSYLRGKLFLKRRQYQKALLEFDKAVSYCNNLQKYDLLNDIYTDKADAHAMLGQYEKAYEMQVLKNQSSELLQPNKIAQVLGEFEREELLKEERAQQALENELEAEKTRSNKYRERVQLQVTAFSSVLLIILLIIVSYYAILRRKHAQVLKENYNTINQQKVMLEKNFNQLAEDEQKLKKLNATKDKFFSIIAHDLKNPFNVMIGISDLIRTNADIKHTKEFETMIDGMFQAATSGYNLLENLLEWSRTQTDSIQFKPENFTIDKIFAANKLLFKEAAHTKNIRISWPSSGIEVFADYNMVNFIFRNLLNNAIKFSNKGGKIDVVVGTDEKMLRCTIKDNGIGMDADTLSKLFKIEYSVQQNGTANEKGTGLGLILCKEFVEKNKGTISVESKEGQGSAFTFELPLGKD